jgi:diguanylate cyclase (GGDEF)-like protein
MRILTTPMRITRLGIGQPLSFAAGARKAMLGPDDSPSRPPPRISMVESRRYVWNGVRAGLLRVLFSLLAVLGLAFFEGLKPFAPVFLAYLGLSLVFQLVIRRRIARSALVVAMGVVDIALVTLLVHLLGSTQTALTFLYLLIPIVFATTTSRRSVSMTLAVLGSLAYVALLVLEVRGVLAFAPALPGSVPPSHVFAFFCGAVVVIALLSTTRFVSQLITALRDANSRLREQSQRDELTGLYNRRYLHTRLDAELGRVQRGAKLMVLMVDLDGFKRVNDEIGHEAGDKVLQAVACALLQATRRSDVVARYGGDEFLVLLPDTTVEGCRSVAARIIDQAREAAHDNYPSIPVTASVGVATARVRDDAAALVRRADEAVYAAKRGGGDRAAVSEAPPVVALAK